MNCAKFNEPVMVEEAGRMGTSNVVRNRIILFTDDVMCTVTRKTK